MIATIIARKVAERMVIPARPKRKPRKAQHRKTGVGVAYSLTVTQAAVKAGLP